MKQTDAYYTLIVLQSCKTFYSYKKSPFNGLIFYRTLIVRNVSFEPRATRDVRKATIKYDVSSIPYSQNVSTEVCISNCKHRYFFFLNIKSMTDQKRKRYIFFFRKRDRHFFNTFYRLTDRFKLYRDNCFVSQRFRYKNFR